MSKRPNISPSLVSRLKRKAEHSDCTYRISGIAFDKKGNILGQATNKHAIWDVLEKDDGVGRAGTARHVERELISQYGKNIKTILICRIGHSGKLRYIDSCPTCRKVAKKYGVKIISICPGSK